MILRTLTLVIAFVPSLPALSQDKHDEPVLASVSYYLSEKEVALYSAEAMRGSAEAALKLTNFYWIRGAPDREMTKYWALIGAENGSAEAQFRAYQRLRSSTERADHLRSIFWLKKAAAQGFVDAELALKRCGSLEQNDASAALPCFGPEAD